MVKILKASEAAVRGRAGYTARYVGEIAFRQEIENAMFIDVRIPAGEQTSPHHHNVLEEVFIALNECTICVNELKHYLEEGDVVLVEPGEEHSFIAPQGQDVRILAIKFPNISEDKAVKSSD